MLFCCWPHIFLHKETQRQIGVHKNADWRYRSTGDLLLTPILYLTRELCLVFFQSY